MFFWCYLSAERCMLGASSLLTLINELNKLTSCQKKETFLHLFSPPERKIHQYTIRF